MLRRRHLLGALPAITGASLLSFRAAQASQPGSTVHVVVNAANPVRALSQRDVVQLFTGRVRDFPGGERAQPLDQGRDSAAREAFYLALTGMDLPRINSYWARLLFSGQVQPPIEVAGGHAGMLAAVRRDATAIGYLLQDPADAPGVRVLLSVPARG